jgi:hypothetical protein
VCWSAVKGLTLSDLVRARDFQARHTLMALRAGEPYRIARALTVAAVHSATGGGRTQARTAELLDATTAIAKRLDNPYSIAFALSVGGVAAYLEGRWRVARDLSASSAVLFRERCRGVAWELANAHYYSMLSLFYLGEVNQLGEALPSLLKEAEDRGDLHALTSMRTRFAYLLQLANDEPQAAREDLRAAIAIWPGDTFRLQHWYEMNGQAECLLYAAEPKAALRLVRDRWPLLERSLLLHTQSTLISSLSFRARAAIATGAGDPEAVALAEKDARRIESERMPWGNALAKLLRAGVASVSGKKNAALDFLAAAERDFAAADMALHATVARRRRGELLGGTEGGDLLRDADEWMATQSIRNPERMAAMLAPGKWS